MGVRTIEVFVASPGDVATERECVEEAAADLNRILGQERGVQFNIRGWKTDVRQRLHALGPQGPIDEDLAIGKFDIVIGILWKRFGQPLPDYGGETGTEHELRGALNASRAARASKRPEVVLCFNQAPHANSSAAEARQALAVAEFREEVEPLGLHFFYHGVDQFRREIRSWFDRYLRAHFPISGPTATTLEDPTEYLRQIAEFAAKIEVQGLRVGDSKAWVLKMDEFYIPLTGSGRSLLLSCYEQRKLMVVGDPGSGKSTFLKRVTHELVKDYQQGRLFPMPVGAAALASYIALHRGKGGPASIASPDWFAHHMAAECQECNRGLTANFFRSMMRSGRCHVLIDGLDEAPTEEARANLAKLIAAAADAFPHCWFTVTSRPEGKAEVSGFEETRIADLEPDAIREFIDKLARELYKESPSQAATFRADLEAAVNRREIRKLTRNPVMLTALAVLQHNHVKLPEKRVELYGSILDWLSKQRAKDGRLPAGECLLRLRELALAMQDHEDGRKKQVALEWAADVLKARFGGSRDKARAFLKAEQNDSGIVVSRGADIAYWHLTFQEYLAALEVHGLDEDAHQHALLLGGNPARIYRPEWRESVLLYAGLLNGVGPRRVDAFLRKILDLLGDRPTLADRARCVGVIGAMLRDLKPYTITDERYAESLRLVMDIFDAEKSKAVKFEDRLAAAEALGQAGDPRLNEIEWVTIPESKGYWIGAQDEDPKGRNYDKEAFDVETPRQVDLPTFRISKYPVTVSQYAPFVEEEASATPGRWEEQQEHPSWPVVEVSWHQASTYAAWKGARLPTEDEWERAARGPKGTKYPWGNADIDPTRANYSDSNVGHPTPVGLFPLGASPEGVLDLIGNILEWTGSEWEKGGKTRVWLGGCFDLNRWGARMAYGYRGRYLPDARNLYLGFRLAGGIP